MLSLKSAFMWPHVGVPTQGMPLKWEGGSLYPTWAQMVPDFLPYYLRCQDFGKHFFLSFFLVCFFFFLPIIFSVLYSSVLQIRSEGSED